MAEIGGWAFKLNDVLVTSCGVFDLCSGSDDTTILSDAGLDDTPDGLAPPVLRVEDVVYPQRDGERHFNDWYTARIITLVGTIGPAGDCGEDCTSVREQALLLMQAWKRSCCDIELVLYPPCYPGPFGFGVGPFGEGPFGGGDMDQNLVGPYGIVGRPRLQPGALKWLYRDQSVAQFVLQFRAVDQRIYILDGCGTPGYEKCTDIEPGAQLFCAPNSGCFADGPMCFTEESSGSVDPTTIHVGGTEVVYPTITLWPNLTNPIVENTTTLDYITYAGTITDYPVIINTEDLTATQNGVSVTYKLAGSLNFAMSPGDYDLRLLTASDDDTGSMTICSRDTLVSA